jgi:hypothetical protein
LLLLISLIIFSLSCVKKHLIKDEKYRDQVKESFDKRKEVAKSREKELFSVFKTSMTSQEREALEFLYAFMPLSDLADYNGEFFLANVRVAMKTRNEMPWGRNVPEAEFLHFVLPVRVNNENLDSFRIVMYKELTERIYGLSMHDAALEINHWCHEKVTYRGSDDRTSSPMSSLLNTIGRCGEESTFTVAALRTVGRPARHVYTPRWAHSDDNHAWVEVWIEGKWYFMGACEPEPDLNMGWFAEPSRRTMLVHTRAYGLYNGNEPVIQKQELFSELNLISNYAPSKTFYVEVKDKDKNTVDSAKVEYQLYNYAEFYPIAKGFTDKNGLHSITTGLGDLIIWANKDNRFGYKKITVRNTDTVRIILDDIIPANLTVFYDMVPPVKPEPKMDSVSGVDNNQHRLKSEDSVRFSYMSTFMDTVGAKKLAYKLSLNTDSVVCVMMKSMGNWKEIESFLFKSKKNNNVKWALKLLWAISDKDLRDTKAEVLNDHLENGFKYECISGKCDPQFYAKYVLSPRIGNELIRPWRSFIQNNFEKEFIKKVQNNVNHLVSWINANIKIDPYGNLHSRAPLSPKGVIQLKVSDSRSRDILFVAICRSFGIPARLDQATSLPQYYLSNCWINIYFDTQRQSQGIGFIHFISHDSKILPKYASNFTISRFEKGNYRTLEFDFDKKLTDFPENQQVESGNYMLITGYRLVDGTVLTSVTFFSVRNNETTNVEVLIRERSEDAMVIGNISPKDFSFTEYSGGKKIPLPILLNDKGSIIIWLEPDKEPTKHIMADLPAFKEVFESWGGNLIFLLSKEETSKSFSPNAYLNLPKKSYFAFDDEMLLLTAVENVVKQILKYNYPVIVIIDSTGKIYFLSEGYKIGIGEQLNKEIQKLSLLD